MVNQAVQDIWGYRAKELIGESLVRLIPEKYRQAHRAGWERYSQTGVSQVLGKRLELEGVRKDGSIFPLEIQITETKIGERVLFTAAVRDITESKKAEEELRSSEGRLRSLMENIPDGVLLLVGGKIIYTNQALATMLGYESAEYQGQSLLKLLHPEDNERATHWMDRILGGAPGSPEEYRGYSKDGSIVPMEVSCRLIEYGGEPALLSVLRDLTERKRMEEQLSHAQRMETVGRLAGGVADDFNNLLTAIMGYSQMSLREAPLDSPISSHLQEVKKASERAANLTNQLLAFSRHQVIEPKVIDLNDLVINTDRMLRRLIGEDVELVTLPATDLEPIKADPGQIEQVLMNLAVNARDAMPAGGKLTVETANVTLDAEYVRQHGDASLGRHVMLVVSDTGVGISEEDQDHIFEPFFTTKEVGKGTGLGLATCYDIVQQSGGHIEVCSEPGRGTSFKVYLPVTGEAGEAQPKKIDSSMSPRGKETVLLAEDEPLVRTMVATVLRDRGYQVLEAANGEEALRVVQKHDGKGIQLLLTDVVMPQMSGLELAEKPHATHPNLKVIFTSGYLGDSGSELDILPTGTEFLPKPYMPETLAVKVREVLDGEVLDR